MSEKSTDEKIIALQLDLARQKENTSFIKDYANFAVQCGYNTIVLYLENAVRTEKTFFFDEAESYTVYEMKEIISYMEGLGLEVIPAFETLYHLEKFFRYDELAELSEYRDERTEGRGWANAELSRGAVGCITNEKLHTFIAEYVTEVASLFKSKYIHFGLDEIFEFAECDRCKKVLATGVTKKELFLGQVLRCHDLAKSLGKEMMMWDDFFEYYDVVEQLPRDIILCNWQYYFVGEEPQGHWMNRTKKDWFRIYDKLGFRYIFCCWTSNASSLNGLESFTAYAEKYTPMGAIMTTWERSNRFYFGQYPCIAYASALWQERIKTEQDKVALYARLLGDEDCAKLLLSLSVPTWLAGYHDICAVAENDYMTKFLYRQQLSYALEKLQGYMQSAKGLAKDILTDIYDVCLEQATYLRLQRLGVEYFDVAEGKRFDAKHFAKELSEMKAAFEEIQKNEIVLWEKHRKGVKSFLNAFENRHKNNLSAVERAGAGMRRTDFGVLYLDLFIPDTHASVKGEISVKYVGEEEKLLYAGVVKPSSTMFSFGCNYCLRFATENKPLEYALFYVKGEGSLGVCNIHHLAKGEKKYPKSVEKACGEVRRQEVILVPDIRYAELGSDDGQTHLDSVQFSRRKHGVKVIFA